MQISVLICRIKINYIIFGINCGVFNIWIS